MVVVMVLGISGDGVQFLVAVVVVIVVVVVQEVVVVMTVQCSCGIEFFSHKIRNG